MSKCDYCEEKATLQENVYGPTTIRCCDDCQSSAAWDLWESSNEEADE